MIRRLSYSDANIFLICFNVVDPDSFMNVREKWIPELRDYGPERVPLILVGLQSDQRSIVDVKCRLSKKGKRPIKYEEGEMLAKKIGAKKYVECSSLTQVIYISLLLFNTTVCPNTTVSDIIVKQK